MKQFVVEKDAVGERVDVFLAKQMPEFSRSNIQKLCESKKVKVNGLDSLSKKLLSFGDRVAVDYDIKSDSSLPWVELPIIYEDQDCVVINKPQGILTHSKGAFNPEFTVETFIKPKLVDMSGERAGIVHRLDRTTSGVMICAKNQTAQKWLQKQFSSRKTKKTYIAIIEGKLSPTTAIIDMPIERDPSRPQSFKVGSHGKPAQTSYKSLAANKYLSLVELKPTTGRTHQLRVHLKHIGHPIVGDNLYGGKLADRLYLHAQDLEITLPSKERKIFTAKLPPEFDKLLS